MLHIQINPSDMTAEQAQYLFYVCEAMHQRALTARQQQELIADNLFLPPGREICLELPGTISSQTISVSLTDAALLYRQTKLKSSYRVEVVRIVEADRVGSGGHAELYRLVGILKPGTSRMFYTPYLNPASEYDFPQIQNSLVKHPRVVRVEKMRKSQDRKDYARKIQNLAINPRLHTKTSTFTQIDEIARPYIFSVMQLIDGMTLYDFLNTELASVNSGQKLSLSATDRVKLSLQLCYAILDQVHAKNYVHMDIKEENIIINPNANLFNPVVIDLEFAQTTTAKIFPHTWNEFKGTPVYASPQHFQKNYLIESENDLYAFDHHALGVLLASLWGCVGLLEKVYLQLKSQLPVDAMISTADVIDFCMQNTHDISDIFQFRTMQDQITDLNHVAKARISQLITKLLNKCEKQRASLQDAVKLFEEIELLQLQEHYCPDKFNQLAISAFCFAHQQAKTLRLQYQTPSDLNTQIALFLHIWSVLNGHPTILSYFLNELKIKVPTELNQHAFMLNCLLAFEQQHRLYQKENGSLQAKCSEIQSHIRYHRSLISFYIKLKLQLDLHPNNTGLAKLVNTLHMEFNQAKLLRASSYHQVLNYLTHSLQQLLMTEQLSLAQHIFYRNCLAEISTQHNSFRNIKFFKPASAASRDNAIAPTSKLQVARL